MNGFAAPVDTACHVFEVPSPGVLVERFGVDVRDDIVRAEIGADAWGVIAQAASGDFGPRLVRLGLPEGAWGTGATRLDRLLGQELCVLMWAAEGLQLDAVHTVCSRWAALKPEGRWWLWSMAAAEGGELGDAHRGWRRALVLALSDDGGQRRARPD